MLRNTVISLPFPFPFPPLLCGGFQPHPATKQLTTQTHVDPNNRAGRLRAPGHDVAQDRRPQGMVRVDRRRLYLDESAYAHTYPRRPEIQRQCDRHPLQAEENPRRRQ